MSFNKSNCIIRKIYCGNGKLPKDTASKKYSRRGAAYECLQRGFGVADWQHRKTNMSKTSLQQIPYIGPVFEANFKRNQIYSITSLINKLDKLSATEKRKIITACCKRKNGSTDQRAFNGIVLFLYEHKMKNLPSCKIVKE